MIRLGILLLVFILGLTNCDIGLSERKDRFMVNCQFVCYELEVDPPAYQLRLIFETTHLELGEIPVCDTIAKEDYARYNIPKNALHAVGGKHSKGTDLFFAILENDSVKIFQNQPDSSTFRYSNIKAFSRLAL